MEYKEYKESKESKLYPTLPSAPEGEVIIVEGTAQSYRLQKINEIQKEIALERDKRANLSKSITEQSKLLPELTALLLFLQWD